MKCARCGTELPGQAQFCLRCGTPVRQAATAAVQGGAVAAAPIRGAAGSRKFPPAAIAAAAIVLLCGAMYGMYGYLNKNATGAGSNVVNAQGGLPNSGRLLDTEAGLNAKSPLVHDAQTAPAPLDPTSVNDYLKFLKEIERERITLARR